MSGGVERPGTWPTASSAGRGMRKAMAGLPSSRNRMHLAYLTLAVGSLLAAGDEFTSRQLDAAYVSASCPRYRMPRERALSLAHRHSRQLGVLKLTGEDRWVRRA